MVDLEVGPVMCLEEVGRAPNVDKKERWYLLLFMILGTRIVKEIWLNPCFFIIIPTYHEKKIIIM